MSTGPLVIFEIQFQNASKARFTQNDDVVQTLTSDRSNQPFDVGVLPGRPWGGEDFALYEDRWGPDCLSGDWNRDLAGMVCKK